MKSNIYFLIVIFFVCFHVFGTAQTKETAPVYPPFVNQTGYNLGESKRFVCYGAPDNSPFKIVNAKTSQTVFEGKMLNNQGWFTEFNPVTPGDEYVVEVEGRGIE